MIDQFLAFSSEVTAFTTFELRGTGLADSYLSAVESVIGKAMLADLLNAYAKLQGVPRPDRDIRLRREIFGDEKLGPIARNIIKMWYIGIWFELPREWTETFGAVEKDVSFMVSPNAYVEGLLWPAIGANPPGARAPGYASWAAPPEIPPVPVLP